jgi:peptidoglycan/xylan/chitin deacetylase (PgdA/CDA1 family)
MSDTAVRREITTTQAGIIAATGRDPRPLFRFPYGVSDPRTIRIVNDLGYGAFRWTIDTLGWKGTSGGQSTATVLRRVLSGLRPGAIMLLHVGANPDDGSTLDADALPTLISQLRARGYGFVTVSPYL